MLKRRALTAMVFILSVCLAIGSPVSMVKAETAQPTMTNGLSDMSKLTFKDSLDAVDYAFTGYEFLTKDKGLFRQYNYHTKYTSQDGYFDTSFALMAAFLATGDQKYLDSVKQTSDYLISILPKTALVPPTPNDLSNIDCATYLGGSGQLQAIQAVAFLAREDKTYLPLMDELTNALVNYAIDPATDLTYYQVNTLTGEPVPTVNNTYETQLGQNCSNVAQTLLIAYETDPAQVLYKQKAVDVLKAIWQCRDRSTNLIPEVWDAKANKVGTALYPYSDFRYDDMGGAYIRALTLAYQVTQDKEILGILDIYSKSLVNAIWDNSFNGGGFRYLTHLDGTPSAQTVETMYGLFIGTLLEAEQVLGHPYGMLYERCLQHADHVFTSGFGLKNYMVPHQINGQTGNYWGNNSDSQLNYAAIQFPFGMELLSQESGNSIYRLTSNQVINTLLSRAKVGDNINEPGGYTDIIKTQPPYGFELNYGEPDFMYQIFYLPTYVLFNSIHPSPGVTIDWQNGLPIGVFGLAASMPFFDRSLVTIDANHKTIKFKEVSGAGTIDLTDMGFGCIKKVLVDSQNYTSFSDNEITTINGTHSYQVFYSDSL